MLKEATTAHMNNFKRRGYFIISLHFGEAFVGRKSWVLLVMPFSAYRGQ